MTEKASPDPLIFDIARASFVDGPGVRTTVFFKGCPLACPWCHNPESQDYQAETFYFPERCIQCKNCEKGNPCFTRARQTVGKPYSPETLADLILQDHPYFKASGGGVTFSGGEALGFPHYLSQVLPILKRQDLHIAIQTCGYFNFDHFLQFVHPHIDLIYFDFKIMDNTVHKKLLGKPNSLILKNFVRLLDCDISLIPRIPLIPHYTATKKNLDDLASFFSTHQIKHCEFLYYNPGAREKSIRLKKQPCSNLPEKAVSMEKNQAWINYFKEKIKYGCKF